MINETITKLVGSWYNTCPKRYDEKEVLSGGLHGYPFIVLD